MLKERVTNFIIMRPGTAVPAAGDRLYDFTTDVLNIPVGGFGAYTGVANSGNPEAVNPATVTTATAEYLQFIQRRDTSADTTPLNQRDLEESHKIGPNCQIKANGTGASVKNNDVWLLGAPNGTVGAVVVEDETEYIVNSGSRGWRTDLYNGNNTPYKEGRFVTPDYFASTIYTTTVQQRDHLMQHVAYDFNIQSMYDVITLCIDSQATVTPTPQNNVITVAQAAALSAGDNIIIGFTDAGQPIRLTVDADLIQTFTLLAAALPSGTGTEQIIPYARPTADNLAATGRLVAGGQAAGTPDAEVDHLMFLSLDHKRATYDEVSQTKERIEVGFTSGFTISTSIVNAVTPSEGSGYYRDVLEWYRGTQGHRIYPGNKPWQQYFVEYGTELVPNGIYDIFVIDSCDKNFASPGVLSEHPRRTVIAVLNTETAGFAGFTGVANPQKAYVQDTINNWVGSTMWPHTAISI